MRMLSAIKKKDEPLLPQTIETPVEDVAVQNKPDQVKEKKSDGKVTKKKSAPKKFLRGFLDGLANLFYMILFLVLWLAPGKSCTVDC